VARMASLPVPRPDSSIGAVTRAREEVRLERSRPASFSVVSYNVLADCHMEPGWYQYTPDTGRTAVQRHPRLMEELAALAGDIICLQEVGEDYHPLLAAELGERGYTGHYCGKQLGTREGLATFYKRDRFKLEQVALTSWNQMLEEAGQERGVGAELVEAVARDHVFLLLQLRCQTTGRLLSLGNIHTLWDNFSQPDVTTLQVALALRRLGGAAGWKDLVMAGDFNSRPSHAAYYLLLNGCLSVAHQRDLAAAATACQDGRSLAELFSDCYQHSCPDLASSYLSVKGTEPDLTNYDDYDGRHPADWTLDYIWYSAGTLRAEAVLDTVGRPTNRIPDQVFPSDHLSLKTYFAFIEPK